MSQFNLKIKDDQLTKAEVQKESTNEPMSKIDKFMILNESQCFNEQKIENEHCRKVLVKLIYLVNQGVQFNEQEVELLFFRITKLFSSNSSRLRAMTYKALKMIVHQKYIHMIFQCLLKDLLNDNQFIKIEALKFIPCIIEDENITQLERFIHNALIDSNLIISSAALIVGIHIVNQFQTLVYKWLFEVVQNLDQGQENIGYHALILFHEIKKINLSQFLKIMILLTKKQLKPLMHFQIIKFIKDILPYTGNHQKQVFLYDMFKVLMTYLFQQIDRKVPLTAFQSSKILINNFEVQNNELVSVQQYIEEHLYIQIDNIEIYSALKLMHLITSQSRLELITQQQVFLIKAQSFNYRAALSQRGILFFLKLNIENTDMYFKKLFDYVAECKIQSNFLKGLREIITENPDYIILVLDFLKCAFSEKRENDLVNYSIQLIEAILKVSKQYLKVAYPILILLTENPGIKNKYDPIKKLSRVLLNIRSTQLDNQSLNFLYLQLKKIEPSQINEDKLKFLRIIYFKFQNLIEKSKVEKQINNKNKTKKQ